MKISQSDLEELKLRRQAALRAYQEKGKAKSKGKGTRSKDDGPIAGKGKPRESMHICKCWTLYGECDKRDTCPLSHLP